MIRIIVADRYSVITTGLENLVRLGGDAEISQLLVDACDSLPLPDADLLLVGPFVSIPEAGRVFRLLKQISSAAAAIIVKAGLSASEALEAREHGISGVAHLGIDAATLRNCIACVLAGKTWIDPGLASQALWSPAAAVTELTTRESEIVSLVKGGLRNKEVARRLNVSEGTVKMHLHHIFAKLRLASRTELALHPGFRGAPDSVSARGIVVAAKARLAG